VETAVPRCRKEVMAPAQLRVACGSASVPHSRPQEARTRSAPGRRKLYGEEFPASGNRMQRALLVCLLGSAAAVGKLLQFRTHFDAETILTEREANIRPPLSRRTRLRSSVRPLSLWRLEWTDVTGQVAHPHRHQRHPELLNHRYGGCRSGPSSGAFPRLR
jgi:hypothetical protein